MSGQFENLKPGDVAAFAPGDVAKYGHTEVVPVTRE